LAWSCSYERDARRLPPLDLEHLRSQSRRRVDSFAKRIDGSQMVERQEDAQTVARREADSLFVRSEASRRLERQRETTSVRASRNLFLQSQSSPALSSRRTNDDATTKEKLKHEAVRELSRDCVRRENLANLTDAFNRQRQFAERRLEQLEQKKNEERAAVANKAQQESDWLQRRMAVEEQRLARSFSSSAFREEERQKVERVRAEHESKLRAEKERRLKAREDSILVKKEREERAAEEREAAQEARRRDKETLRLKMQNSQAEEDCRRLYQVWCEAEAVLKRRQDELDKLREELLLLNASSGAGADDQSQASREVLARKKRDAATKRVEVAKKNYEEATIRLRNSSTPAEAPKRRAADA